MPRRSRKYQRLLSGLGVNSSTLPRCAISRIGSGVCAIIALRSCKIINRTREWGFDLAQKGAERLLLAFEFLGQCVCIAREQPDVGPHGHKQISPVNIAAGLLPVAREYSSRLADRSETLHCV